MTDSLRPKRVLAVCYSQTGQLSRIADNFLAPLRESSAIALHVESLRPIYDYPFPWPFLRFFDTFPETVHADAPQLQPLTLKTQASPAFVHAPLHSGAMSGAWSNRQSVTPSLLARPPLQGQS